MRRAQWLSFGFLALLLVCNSAQAEQIRFKADLAAPPGITSSGKGTATASLDTTTKTLSWTVDYSGLSGPATAAHIHGPADPGANAGIVVPFTGNLASPIKGTATLTD
ncbi:MAG: CHRD domain-containing protein, partial [Alphaproteobacteria bacterium]|nr:CHRD domain-containing protein [Alphaproteobacteria bacterium]